VFHESTFPFKEAKRVIETKQDIMGNLGPSLWARYDEDHLVKQHPIHHTEDYDTQVRGSNPA